MRSFIAVLLALVAGYGVFSSVNTLQSLRPRQGRFEELFYFPSGVFVREATVGYRNLAADAIWLEFIQYYGEHRLTDQKFLYLGHILDVLTDLDPRFLSAYTYGALLLVTDANEPSRGIALLRKGMKNNPLSWQIPFTAGFLDYIFLRDYDEAEKYFAQAAILPDAPPSCDRFAGYVAQKMNQGDVAQAMLEHVLAASHNRDEQNVLRYYLMKLHLKQLNEAAEVYRELTGRTPDRFLRELTRSGLLLSLPEEPHGGRYYFNPDSGRVVSTWRFRP